MATTIAQPPFTPTEPVIDVLHGIEIADPYRWLEDQNTPRTRRWIEEQTQYTRAYFDAIPSRNRVRERVSELLSMDVLSEIWSNGENHFFLKREPGSEQPCIVRSRKQLREYDVLVNPALRGTGAATAVGIAALSDNAHFLAYSRRQGGTDYCSLEVLDVKNNRVLPDSLPDGYCSGLVFASDDSGFFYSHRGLHDPRPNYRSVRRHRFGTDPAHDEEVFFVGEQANTLLNIHYLCASDVLIYAVVSTGKHRQVSLYRHCLKDRTQPTELLKGIEGFVFPLVAHEQLFAYTDLSAPNRRIVRVDIDDPDPAHWLDIAPESDLRIQQVAIAGELVFVTRVNRFSTIIEGWSLDGRGPVDLNFRRVGSINLLNRTTQSDKLFFSYTSIHSPPNVYCMKSGWWQETDWKSSRIQLPASELSIQETSYTSKDGTPIPLLLAARKELLHSKVLPTFLTGYGGFGAAVTPRFTAFATFLIEQGFLLAVPALRGGSELGEKWHIAGKRKNRQNSFDDFIAAAEWLLANERSVAGQIAIGGGSNAALLVGAAITQRPDLFRAAICLGPVFDMLRYHLFDFAATWVEEFGSAEESEDFHALLSYSPYHQIQKGVSYPAVMIISGDADNRCNPMHARKMAARLQSESTLSNPVLLDYRESWGHMPVQPLSSKIEALSDRLVFIFHELGICVQHEGAV